MMGAGQQTPQARYMTEPKHWPLVNTLNSRNQGSLLDARLVNAYAEKDPDSGEYDVEKRFGFSPNPAFANVGGPAVGRGIFSYSSPTQAPIPTIIYITGTNAYLIPAELVLGNLVLGTPILLLGGLVGYNNTGKFQFTAIPGTVNPLVIYASNKGLTSTAYVYSSGAQAILNGGDSSGFPSQVVSGIVYLDGYCYVMDIFGGIWQTAVVEVVAGAGAWSANVIYAQNKADQGVQLAKQSIYIIAIKTWSTQFFYDAGNPNGSSLSPVPGATFDIGCLDSDTFADLDGTQFWVSQSEVGSYGIAMCKDMQISNIATPAVARQLELGPGSTWYSLCFQRGGHSFYVITNVSKNTTMVYDVGEKLWHIWTDFAGNYWPVVSRTQSPFGTEWHQLGSTGAVYEVEPDYIYPNDYGNVVPVDIYTPNETFGVDRIKYLSQMRIDADQTTGSSLLIRYSDNDYTSWSSFRKVDLGQQRPIINDEGSFYRRAYHFRHFANTAFRIGSAELQMDIGTL